MFSTADNIYNLLYRHEYKGHGVMRLSDHYEVYQLQFNDPSWEKATDEFKRRMQKESEQYK
uniref:Uncharacterized protein n=1 Tax=Prevotella sp. GTC17260 TaxID=3236796 RepID=A0AB33JFC4_9BACT